MTEYIYLVFESNFLRECEHVYRVGTTTRPDTRLIKNYPKQSILILWVECSGYDNARNRILQLFEDKFDLRDEYGPEYFEGDQDEMCLAIIEAVTGDQKNKKLQERVDTLEKDYLSLTERLELLEIKSDEQEETIELMVTDLIELDEVKKSSNASNASNAATVVNIEIPADLLVNQQAKPKVKSNAKPKTKPRNPFHKKHGRRPPF